MAFFSETRQKKLDLIFLDWAGEKKNDMFHY